MKEVFTLEFIRTICLRAHEWGMGPVPESLVPWIQSLFLLAVILVPMVVISIVLNKSKGKPPKNLLGNDPLNSQSNLIFHHDVDDPVAMVQAFESIKRWTESYGIPWLDVRLEIRENPENFLMRFHLPGLELSNEQIDSFLEKKLTDYSFEYLFIAKGYLSATRGMLNVYRSVEGGTCIDAIVRTDKKLEQMKAKIQELDRLIGHRSGARPPDFLDTVIDSWLILPRYCGHLLKRWASHKETPKVISDKITVGKP
ncbi:MAG: hypothetical protein KCHDKBKB_01008 [Elusimicrobia bacterium]|nr:hypothetical protein [Elusimicrobiota bacterium]